MERNAYDDPFYDLLVQTATLYADDSKFDSLVERVITEAPLCTCEWGYKGSHPLLHEEKCPLHTGYPLIIDDTRDA